MGLFTDLFSTKPAEEAAAAKAAGYTSGNAAAQSSLDAGRAGAGTALTAGQTSADAALAGGLTTSNADLTSGQAGADALYGRAYAPYASLIDSTGRGATAYGNATGVNGQAGIDAAGSTFKSLPGYSGGLTTGIDQVMRTNAASGNLGGGNNTADEIKFASDYDANKYGNYIASLAPYLGANQGAIAGGAGVLGNEASADLGVAGTRAGNELNVAGLRSGNIMNVAGAQSAADLSTGGQKAKYGYDSATGVGGANADAALAPYAASQNFWGALVGGANMALKASGVGGYGTPTKAAA